MLLPLIEAQALLPETQPSHDSAQPCFCTDVRKISLPVHFRTKLFCRRTVTILDTHYPSQSDNVVQSVSLQATACTQTCAPIMHAFIHLFSHSYIFLLQIEQSFNYLEIQGISCNKPTQVTENHLALECFTPAAVFLFQHAVI